MKALQKTGLTILVALLVLPLPFFILNVNGQKQTDTSHCDVKILSGFRLTLQYYTNKPLNESVRFDSVWKFYGFFTGKKAYDDFMEYYILKGDWETQWHILHVLRPLLLINITVTAENLTWQWDVLAVSQYYFVLEGGLQNTS